VCSPQTALSFIITNNINNSFTAINHQQLSTLQSPLNSIHLFKCITFGFYKQLKKKSHFNQLLSDQKSLRQHHHLHHSTCLPSSPALLPAPSSAASSLSSVPCEPSAAPWSLTPLSVFPSPRSLLLATTPSCSSKLVAKLSCKLHLENYTSSPRGNWLIESQQLLPRLRCHPGLAPCRSVGFRRYSVNDDHYLRFTYLNSNSIERDSEWTSN
jgi:hypothetical protein